MCGIVACLSRDPALGYLLPGLQRLEYRGYDSAGVAVQDRSGAVVRLRSVGHLASLAELVAQQAGPELDGVGIGHTRWATHGAVSEDNSHPHADCHGRVFVVHNGIIENADELRRELEASGHRFSSDVDSETVAHLVERELGAGADLGTAVARTVHRLRGTWALAVILAGRRQVVVTACGSPLVVAGTPHGVYAASDLSALAGVADHVQVVEHGAVVVIDPDGVTWRSSDGARVLPPRWRADVAPADLELGPHPDFMAKEIAEQAQAVAGVVDRLVPGVRDGSLWRALDLAPLERVRFIACGTSLNAASVLARVLASFGVPATAAPASEHDGWVREPGALTVALSQSGETADVLRAVETQGSQRLLAFTNAPHSTLARLSHAVVPLGVGTEVGVAATKTFTAQVVAGAAVVVAGLVASDLASRRAAAGLADRLRCVPDQLALADELASSRAPGVVARVRSADGYLFAARGAALPYAAEGALKLKEITYRWADCYAAGELKHGPIALIDRGTPAVVVDDGHPKLAGNVAEMGARGARILDVGGPGSVLPYRAGAPDDAPWGPLASVVTLQHLARLLAVSLGRDVDKPRNLAKSVTVE